MKECLIVIDMLNDFILPTGALYCGPTVNNVVELIEPLVEDFRDSGDQIIFLGDSHKHNDIEFNRFPKHCIEGTEGANIISSLNFNNDTDILITKTRYSGFHDTSLDFQIKRLYGGSKEAVFSVVGVCTSICVMLTVADLVNRDYKVEVYKQGVTDFNPASHKFALTYMKDILGVNVI